MATKKMFVGEMRRRFRGEGRQWYYKGIVGEDFRPVGWTLGGIGVKAVRFGKDRTVLYFDKHSEVFAAFQGLALLDE